MQRAFQADRALARSAGVVPRIVIFSAATTVATGLSVRAAGGRLGTALPPFVGPWAPRLGALAAVSVAVLAIGTFAAPLAARRLRSPLAFAAALFVLALAFGLALNLARSGTRGWYAIFDTGPQGSFEAKWEYLPGLPALSYGAHFFLDRFAELVPALPVNVAGHPPGLLLTLHALGIRSPRAMAALCIGTGALTAPLAYDLGRSLGDEERGRTAGLLTAFAPSLLLFGVTSADYLYATLGAAAACLLVRQRAAARGAGAALLAVAAFFSWLLLAIAAWAALVVLVREGGRRAAQLAAACALAVLALNGGLAAWTGYDPIGALRSTHAVYGNSLASVRPYAFWAFGSPTAWLVMLGLPTAVMALRSLSRRDPAALALAAIVVAAAVLGFTKAETERIWLPFVPLACVAAAASIDLGRVRPLLWALAAQALAVELLFYTIW
jgi:methylthioxylose transferase